MEGSEIKRAGDRSSSYGVVSYDPCPLEAWPVLPTKHPSNLERESREIFDVNRRLPDRVLIAYPWRPRPPRPFGEAEAGGFARACGSSGDASDQLVDYLQSTASS